MLRSFPSWVCSILLGSCSKELILIFTNIAGSHPCVYLSLHVHRAHTPPESSLSKCESAIQAAYFKVWKTRLCCFPSAPGLYYFFFLKTVCLPGIFSFKFSQDVNIILYTEHFIFIQSCILEKYTFLPGYSCCINNVSLCPRKKDIQIFIIVSEFFPLS